MITLLLIFSYHPMSRYIALMVGATIDDMCSIK